MSSPRNVELPPWYGQRKNIYLNKMHFMHLLSPQATLIMNIMIGKYCKERNKSPLPVKNNIGPW